MSYCCLCRVRGWIKLYEKTAHDGLNLSSWHKSYAASDFSFLSKNVLFVKSFFNNFGGRWSNVSQCSIIVNLPCETVFLIFQHIIFGKMSIRVNKEHICFCNLMSGKYKHFVGLVVCECCGCIYLFTTHDVCTVTGEHFPLETYIFLK